MSSMYFILILFFSSLFSIIIMIGRKLALLKNVQRSGGFVGETTLFEIPYVRKIRHATAKNAKKYAHVGLIVILRLYFRSNSLLKNKYQEVKIRIKSIGSKKGQNGDPPPEPEVSKFLKMMSEYKHKIRQIKHKIKEEEESQ